MSLLHIAGGVTEDKLDASDVFSTYLYTGNGSTQTINNGIDLAGKGGLVWIKERGTTTQHHLFDTTQGSRKYLGTDSTSAISTTYSDIYDFGSFNSNGFSLQEGWSTNINISGHPTASWTFRKAPKFFDIVTYTGNGVAGRQIAHNLGSTPGCIIVKRTDSDSYWYVYHTSLGNNQSIILNTTDAASVSVAWNNTTPTSTVFTVGSGAGVNFNGGTYVAYLFAHDSSADGIIQCGSFTTSATLGVQTTVTLGWEPQFVMLKLISGIENWVSIDSMRGMTVGGVDAVLYPNLSAAEDNTSYDFITPTATGFYVKAGTGVSTNATYIYIAIRRPMKTPTSGTEVYNAVSATASSGTLRTIGLLADLIISSARLVADGHVLSDRLRGFANSNVSTDGVHIYSQSTNAESRTVPTQYEVWNTTFKDGAYANGQSNVWHTFKRAKGFFDVVCYTGTGSTSQTVNHNLGVAPEFIILKCRNTANDGGATNGSIWNVIVKSGNTAIHFAVVGSEGLNFSGASTWSEPWADVGITSTTFKPYSITGAFTTSPAGATNGNTYVAYLFATCAGVSKVGSYTGNGSSQTINCGFSTGARFVLSKAVSTTGNWNIGDSTRGITSGTDPLLCLNTTAAEVTTDDWLDPESSGFIVNETASAHANTNGVQYVFLAIS